MKETITPCPINEKDLCSDTLFEGLFDDDAHCWDGFGTLIGFLNGGVVKITYDFGSNEVNMQLLNKRLDDKDLKRIDTWLKDVINAVNDNSIDDSTTLVATHRQPDVRTCIVTFNYLTIEK